MKFTGRSGPYLKRPGRVVIIKLPALTRVGATAVAVAALLWGICAQQERDAARESERIAIRAWNAATQERRLESEQRRLTQPIVQSAAEYLVESRSWMDVLRRYDPLELRDFTYAMQDVSTTLNGLGGLDTGPVTVGYCGE